jgi:hypothetical protein
MDFAKVDVIVALSIPRDVELIGVYVFLQLAMADGKTLRL